MGIFMGELLVYQRVRPRKIPRNQRNKGLAGYGNKANDHRSDVPRFKSTGPKNQIRDWTLQWLMALDVFLACFWDLQSPAVT